MIRLALALLSFLAVAAPARAADRPWPVAGRPTTARANGSQLGLERVSIETNGQTLRIRPLRNIWGAEANADPGPVTIELTTRSLRSARLLGPATLDVEGAAGLNVDFMVEGSGMLRATRIAADTLSLGLLGAGTLEVAGTAKTLRGQFQGTGSVAAASLAADAATITTNTVGAVVLQVNGRAEISAYGLGTVTIGGAPACVLNGPGVSQVRCGPNSSGTSDQGQAR